MWNARSLPEAPAAHRTRLVWLLMVGVLGCGDGGDQGPPPPVRLSIQGQVLSAEPSPLSVAGATVALRDFKGFESSQTLAQTTSSQAGRYQLTYTFTSLCKSPDQAGYWIEASAKGYEMRSTISFDTPFSDPPIYCTNDPQVIDLSLQPLGWLQLTTKTGGSGVAPDSYSPTLTGRFPYLEGERSVAYPMGANAAQILELLPGQFALELTEVAGNCTVAGENPRTVTVAARDTVVSTFEVTCAP